LSFHNKTIYTNQIKKEKLGKPPDGCLAICHVDVELADGIEPRGSAYSPSLLEVSFTGDPVLICPL